MIVPVLQEKFDSLKNAVDFYKKCKADKSSWETGGLRDALEWLFESAEELVNTTEDKNAQT